VPRPVTGVHVVMAKSSSPNDYLHSAVLEYSVDGATWSSLGSFGQASIQATTNVIARYVRLRSTAAQTYWVVVDEFAVTVRPAAAPLTNLPTYQTFAPANFVDGDVTSWFWSNGAPPVGGYVTVDLGAARTIGAIDLLMAKDSSINDYLHSGVLESSVDGANWTVLASFSGHNEITVTPPAGSTARYVRARNTGSQIYWLVADEFLVS